MRMQASEILSAVSVLRANRETVIVAIDGAGGAGKSVLAESARVALKTSGIPVSVVHSDDFFHPSRRRPEGGPLVKPIGGDLDWPRLRDQVLEPLRRGETARYDRYDWVGDALAGVREVRPGRVVIVEGIYSSRRELASLYDLKVWVECPRELRLIRGLERDGEGARARWENDWMPHEDRYIETHRPQEYADVTINMTAPCE